MYSHTRRWFWWIESPPEPSKAQAEDVVEMVNRDCALVFSCDEAFAPLARGLVHSVRQLGEPGEFALHLVDIGCSEDTLRWMRRNEVFVATFEPSKFLRKPRTAMKNYQQAQLCRPFLPKLFPGFETYLWCDSDIWVQNIESLRLYRDIAKSDKQIVPICPLIDTSYNYFYENCSEFVAYSRHWYENAYGPTVAENYAARAVLSSGVFAIHSENDIWSHWASELDAIFQRVFASHDSVHLAEQIALNYLLYARGCFAPVEAIHNYNCHVGRISRDHAGHVSISDAPHRKIGVVHLTYSSKMMSTYIDSGLLFDRGGYLNDDEIEKLRKLSHY